MLYSPRTVRIASVSVLSTLSFAFLLGCSGQAGGSFNPRNPNGLGPAPVNLSSNGGALNPADLSSAGNYVILSKAGIATNAGTSIVGHLGVSPAAAGSITGFNLSADPAFVFATSSLVSGRVYAANYSAPTATNLTTAIGSMETAYTDAAGRSPPDFNELATGNIGSRVLTPGLYTWAGSVTIPTNTTITGSATDVWIFQIAGNLDMSSSVAITLAGGALARNIYWQVAGAVQLQTSSHFEGNILCKTAVTLLPGATLNGRIFSQTAVTLNSSTVTQQ